MTVRTMLNESLRLPTGERTQPGRPMKPGGCGTMTHDYKRKGTTSLFAALDLHLIEDHYGTHKHPQVRSWLSCHRRIHLRFIPTSSSWLNLVERWFGKLTEKRIRRGSFFGVEELI